MKRHSSFAKLAVLAVLLAVGALACSPRPERVRLVHQDCLAPRTVIGQAVHFQAEVLAQTENNLHIDFDGFGADFSSLTVKFSSPPAWSGVVVDLHYQGEPVMDGVALLVGSSFQFEAAPPECINRLWFLHPAEAPE
ncbi:hypothetical protein [Aquimonas sp.]|uniref:hypothetical protein n=1 Tax=Aquimonas sp. TaxID=1872588 RepID=UPI0037C1933C